jgi:hypothetical protein
MAILRSVLSVFVGSIVAMVFVMAIQFVGHQLFVVPLPPDLKDPEALVDAIGNLMAEGRIPLGALVAVLIAWCAGSLSGAFVAAKLATRAPRVHGLIVGAMILGSSVLNLVMLPHPIWFAVAALLFVPASAWLGATLGARRNAAAPVAD